MLIESILSSKGRDVVTVDADATIADLIETLANRNIGAVVATDSDGKVVGIVSERDVVRQLAVSAEGLLQKSVGALMTRSLKTCTRTDTIDTAMAIMTKGRFRHLPVIENGELVGIISIGDVVKRKIEEVQHESEALREYIAS